MKLSLRFKLTLLYSFIFILSTSIFLIVANAVVQQQYNRSPEEIFTQLHDDDDFAPHSPQQMHILIEEIRQEDMSRIQTTIIILFVALMGLSFLLGYIMSGWLLQPLHKAFELQKQFIANASHELKTPLTIAQLNLETILHDPQMSQAELKQYLRQGVASITFMNQLIEDLLLLALTQEQITTRPVNVGAVVQTAVDQLSVVAKTHDKLVTYAPNTMAGAVTVQGNATLLQRAVMNCIENAIKYANHTITVGFTIEHNHPTIKIVDDGCGIPADELAKVTERFYRVDSSRSRVSGGTGLGLAITKTIIELHGGELHLTSTIDRGTTVTIIL